MTQQHKPDHARDAVTVIHRAANSAEATVLRGVLQSAGIKSPADSFTDPFPMQEPPAGFTGTEILVLDSQKADAQKIIDDYYREDKKNERK
jgi:hypothetical protein